LKINVYCRLTIPVPDFQSAGQYLMHHVHNSGTKPWRNSGPRRDSVFIPSDNTESQLNESVPAFVEFFLRVQLHSHTTPHELAYVKPLDYGMGDFESDRVRLMKVLDNNRFPHMIIPITDMVSVCHLVQINKPQNGHTSY